ESIKVDGVRYPTVAQLIALGEYCKNDTDICKGIYEKLMPSFPKSQLWSMDWTIRTFINPRLQLSKTALEKGVKDEKARRESAIKASGVSKDVLSSNQQFAKLLVERGISVRTKMSPRTGKAIPAFAKTDVGLDIIKDTHPTLYAARLASKSTILETR